MSGSPVRTTADRATGFRAPGWNTARLVPCGVAGTILGKAKNKKERKELSSLLEN